MYVIDMPVIERHSNKYFVQFILKVLEAISKVATINNIRDIVNTNIIYKRMTIV